MGEKKTGQREIEGKYGKAPRPTKKLGAEGAVGGSLPKKQLPPLRRQLLPEFQLLPTETLPLKAAVVRSDCR